MVSGNYAGFAEVQIYQLPSVLSLANSAATGVAATTAALNATLGCTGSVYRVVCLLEHGEWGDERRVVDQLGLCRLLDQRGLDAT